ncbi:amidase [Homoserinibacter sp. YIM 151385]|uniref:amidase n=1 Tax=Homoserinibacter sp. YIM 151385 TaxID=2985506 RepID=UPI0022F049C0|nr:amidase [Homoserinibacter sp. YIM 151385]WBU38257.1 amidase [Homoserinibacter sp. YIM 151385]
MFELHHLTALEQLDWLRRGEVTPLELVDHYLARIERLDTGEGALGAFATVTPEAARRRAAALAASPGRAAALWGLPLADKDLSARAGIRTMFGSRAFAAFVPEASDEIVEAVDAAGAVSLGKTVAPEFGMPSHSESLVSPPARTPWDPRLGAGGSSGGAAVAVSAGLLPLAPGSDGGGSIRIPAAATGLVGLKPSRGLVPAGTGFGSPGALVVPGPLARTVADAALLLDALVEQGDYDSATRAPGWADGAYLDAAVRGEGRFNLGATSWSPWAHDFELAPSAETLAALDVARRELDAIGHGLEPFDLPPEPEYSDAFRVAWQAGASAIPVEGERLALLEPLTRWLVEAGRRLPASALVAAQRTLNGVERRTIRAFSRFDAVLMPGMAMTPRPIGWYDHEDPERNFAQQVAYTPWTSFVNVAGLPAISLPVHETAAGLPMAVQLVGRPGGERVLLAIGAQLERRLGWHRRHPPRW